MKNTTLFIYFFIFYNISFSQNVVFKKSEVIVDGSPALTFKKTMLYAKSEYYEFFNKQKKLLINIQFTDMGSSIVYVAAFPITQRSYGSNNGSEKTVEQLLQVFYQNKVLISDSISLKGLEDFCNSKELYLSDTGPEEKNMHQRNAFNNF